MMIETNNIHALRVALDRVDDLRVSLDDVMLHEDQHDEIEQKLIRIETLLERELRRAEKALVEPVVP